MKLVVSYTSFVRQLDTGRVMQGPTAIYSLVEASSGNISPESPSLGDGPAFFVQWRRLTRCARLERASQVSRKRLPRARRRGPPLTAALPRRTRPVSLLHAARGKLIEA